MINLKLYKYNADAPGIDNKGKDYTAYIQQGATITEDLTEVLDKVELTLYGVNFREEFAPTTKFILEIWSDDIIIKTYHLCVAEDLVSQPILSDNNYFIHSITFYEASVVAQQRIVDNIAVTYKLKDVSFKTIQFDENANAIYKNKTIGVSGVEFQNGYKYNPGWFSEKVKLGHKFEVAFPTWYNETDAYYSNGDEWQNLKYYQLLGEEQSKTIQLHIPFFKVYSSVNNSEEYRYLGLANSEVVIIDTNLEKDTITTKTISTELLKNISTESEWNNEKLATINITNGYILNRQEWRSNIINIVISGNYSCYVKKVAERVDNTTQDKRVINLTIEPNHKYEIKVKPKNFNNGEDFKSGAIYASVDNDKNIAYYCYSEYHFSGAYNDAKYITDELDGGLSLIFECYKDSQTAYLFHSAPPISAYDLFIKSQIASGQYKVVNTKIKDLNLLPFRLSGENEELLKNTEIIETFYHEKNLWEIFLDIGKYIHSIPKIRFDSTGNFIVDFVKLGNTEQTEDEGNKISIYNSRSVENYISECNSYITNLVQLDTSIEETLVAKSESEDYLVYNDVAMLKTSKSIIEIVELKVVNSNNKEVDITDNVYEKNMYDLLSINKDDTRNKGNSIWYSLGDNKIQGFNYILPSVNTGENDYAIKNIIASAFSIASNDIKVNDYYFKIKYRTKDSVRINQVRPDLRKYLNNNTIDKIPKHAQFNNQTDITIDSAKFGSNTYGKLIKTGNTQYTIKEWVDNVINLKEIGQLVNMYDNLYYVAKTTNTYYKNHIISDVEYSKDYNQLSEIIGIPSEPRFYEISEQSLINREIAFNNYLELRAIGDITADTDADAERQISFLTGNGMFDLVKNIILGSSLNLPKYAYTIFKNNENDNYNNITNATFKKAVYLPLNIYSTYNTLTFEWDTLDNFSAGDSVNAINKNVNNDINKNYNTLNPTQYTDTYGRADMVDFAIFNKTFINNLADTQKLPNPPFAINDIYNKRDNAYIMTENVIKYNNNGVGSERNNFNTNNYGIPILKDSREQLSFNYNINLITNSDRFIISPYLYNLSGNRTCQVAFLNTEVSKITNGEINSTNIISRVNLNTQNSSSNYVNTPTNMFSFRIRISNLTIPDNAKSIAIIFSDEKKLKFVIARNIDGLDNEGKKKDWQIRTITKIKTLQ